MVYIAEEMPAVRPSLRDKIAWPCVLTLQFGLQWAPFDPCNKDIERRAINRGQVNCDCQYWVTKRRQNGELSRMFSGRGKGKNMHKSEPPPWHSVDFKMKIITATSFGILTQWSDRLSASLPVRLVCLYEQPNENVVHWTPETRVAFYAE